MQNYWEAAKLLSTAFLSMKNLNQILAFVAGLAFGALIAALLT